MVNAFEKNRKKNKQNYILLEALLRYSNEIIIVVTKDYIVEEFNRKAEIYFGQSREALLKKKLPLSMPSGKKVPNIRLNELIYQETIHLKDNELEWSITMIESFSNKNSSYILIGKLYPTNILQNGNIQYYLEFISSFMPGNFYWKDKNGGYLGHNDALLQTLGFSSKESVIGKTDYDIWPNDAEAIVANDKTVMMTRAANYFEETVTTESGEKRYFTGIKVPLFDESNHVIGVIGNSLPITEIKNNQFALESAKKRVEKERDSLSRYLQELISHIPGSIYWKDKEGIYLGCNDFMAKTAGLNSIEEIIGKTDYELWPDEAESLLENDKSVMASGQTITIEEEILVSDQKRFFTVVKAPLRDADGKVSGVMGNSLEITALKQTQSALKVAKEKAETANRSKIEFLENMRHDIRTPLIGIVGFAKNIRDEVSEPRINEYVDNLVASSDALLDLLNEILEVIKVSSGEVPILKKKFDLKNRLLDVIKLNQAKAYHKHIDLSLHYDESLPAYVLGDPRRVHRIVLELVANALNFTQKGFVKVTVQLAKKKRREIIVKMIVEDSGIGIEHDKQQEIFLKFKRLTPSYEGIYKGAGLGLAIVKQFVDELEGEVYVKSKVGKGATFTCILPLKKALLNEEFGCDKNVISEQISSPISTPKINEFSPTRVEKKGELDKENILLVEDQLLSAKIVITILEELGCKVDLAVDGKSAIQKVKEKNYDLIFMDIGLPDIDGYEITKRIRSYELNQGLNTPIIALTAHVEDEKKQRCIEVGMNAVLTKPLIKQKIEEILSGFTPYRKQRELKNQVIQENFVASIEGKIVDFEAAKKTLNNNEDLVYEMLTEMVKTLPVELDKMKGCYKNEDWVGLQNISHKIKGCASYCGTVRLKEACYQLEKIVKDGRRDLYLSMYELMTMEINAVKKVVEEMIKNKSSQLKRVPI